MRQTSQLLEFPGRVSTLLVGRRHQARLIVKIKKHRRLNLYLEFLLKRYATNGSSGRIQKERTEYQSNGLDLRAFRFRPSNPAWLALGLLARQAGVSRCRMFVYLFLKDLANKLTVPTNLREKFKKLIYIEVLDPVHLIWERWLRESPA
ncbi:MAG: DUF1564 domain-containing protein [Spirochaetia bacterium]|nr:DUF1564 domain-containing protein [Spirochaetia bacterium]